MLSTNQFSSFQGWDRDTEYKSAKVDTGPPQLLLQEDNYVSSKIELLGILTGYVEGAIDETTPQYDCVVTPYSVQGRVVSVDRHLSVR